MLREFNIMKYSGISKKNLPASYNSALSGMINWCYRFYTYNCCNKLQNLWNL